MKKFGCFTTDVLGLCCVLSLCVGAAARELAPITSITLSDPNGMTNDSFGASVAISGNTLVVGAPDTTYNGNPDQGTAYVFVKTSGGWMEAAQLIASDGAFPDEFGSAVAIASNGTVVVGAPNKVVKGNPAAGEAYVFEAPSGGWKPGTNVVVNTIPPLTGAEGITDEFGYSVAISSNATDVIVGEPQYPSGYGPGTVYAFASPSWGLAAKFNSKNKSDGDSFGYSVGISGTTIVAGAPGVNEAYAIQVPSLMQTEFSVPGGDEFGLSVAISGTTIAVGAPYSEAAYVFTSTRGVWSQVAELTPSDSTSGEFGSSVATIGSAVLVGGPEYSSSTVSFAGGVYLFTKAMGGWGNQSGAAVVTGTNASEHLGNSMSISGETAVVGAYGFNSFEGEALVLSK
jgi:hypothetical protein